MIKVSIKNWLIFILISAPFIDLINGAMTFLFQYQGMSVGQIIRIVFFGVNLSILLKIDFRKFILMFILCTFFILQIYITISLGNINTVSAIFSEIIYDVKFLYSISFIILISSAVKQGKVTKDILIKNTIRSTVLLSSMLIITTLANLSVGSYGNVEAYGNVGSRGLFMEINAVAASMIIGLGLQLNIYFDNLWSKKNFLKSVVLLMGLILIGTKAAIVFSIILISYFLFRESFTKKIFHSLSAICIGILIIILIVYYFVYGNGVGVIERLSFFYNQMDFMSFIFSGRNQTLQNIFSFWTSKIYYIIFGTGYNYGSDSIKCLISGLGSIEMDFFDIYYFYGSIVGTIMIFVFGRVFFKSMINFLKNKGKSLKSNNLIYIIAVICTMFGGHVLFSPLASVYFVVTFVLNKYPNALK